MHSKRHKLFHLAKQKEQGNQGLLKAK